MVDRSNSQTNIALTSPMAFTVNNDTKLSLHTSYVGVYDDMLIEGNTVPSISGSYDLGSPTKP